MVIRTGIVSVLQIFQRTIARCQLGTQFFQSLRLEISFLGNEALNLVTRVQYGLNS
jgi:hypothetical protein